MSYSVTQTKRQTPQQKKESDLSDVFGYDVSLITKDLQKTIIVSLSLIAILIFLAWYLPIGILSS